MRWAAKLSFPFRATVDNLLPGAVKARAPLKIIPQTGAELFYWLILLPGQAFQA
jgi:hypothetical protein